MGISRKTKKPSGYKGPMMGENIEIKNNKNKNKHSHTMEYYSVIKRNKVLLYATTEKNLTNMMLSERSQAQKVTHCNSIYMKYP